MDYYSYGEYYDTDYLDDHDDEAEEGRKLVEKQALENLEEKIKVRSEKEREDYERMLMGGIYSFAKYLESTVSEYDLMLLNKGGRSPPNGSGSMGSF